MEGLCDICGAVGRMSSCMLCGRRVCARCFVSERGVCCQCSQGRRVKK
jgi:hypothetical protein